MNISTEKHTTTGNANLYDYQQTDIDTLFEKLEQSPDQHRLLYQLPTGGGKTRIFSEIASRFIAKYHQKVIVLTHRIELCHQTSATLKKLGIKNKVIDSTVKQLGRKDVNSCYVAMVETLKNRIKDGIIKTEGIGLVIIDEAHHNSFHKLLGKFDLATLIGVTATPFSSDINLPMREHYYELVVGVSISSLIEQGFLAKPTTWRYDVELNTLKPACTATLRSAPLTSYIVRRPCLTCSFMPTRRMPKIKRRLFLTPAFSHPKKCAKCSMRLAIRRGT